MIVKYYQKHVYGTLLYYVVDKHQAYLISALTGCKTLKQAHMIALAELGVTFELVHQPGGMK